MLLLNRENVGPQAKWARKQEKEIVVSVVLIIVG